MGFYSLAMEFPIYQFSCCCELVLRHIWAPFEIFEDLLTDRNGTFYDLRLDLLVGKSEVHDIEEPSSVNSPHNWNSSNEMMTEEMPMPLNNSIQRALRKLIDELRHFVIEADTFLGRGFFPNSKGIICITLVSDMAEQHNSINSLKPQFFALPDYMGIIW